MRHRNVPLNPKPELKPQRESSDAENSSVSLPGILSSESNSASPAHGSSGSEKRPAVRPKMKSGVDSGASGDASGAVSRMKRRLLDQERKQRPTVPVPTEELTRGMAVRALDSDDESSDPASPPFKEFEDDNSSEDTYEVFPWKLSREAETRANKERERVASRRTG
jgi:hypothetical protein